MIQVTQLELVIHLRIFSCNRIHNLKEIENGRKKIELAIYLIIFKNRIPIRMDIFSFKQESAIQRDKRL